MSNFLHRWLNPHCPHCKEELEYARVCLSCETLRAQLEISRLETKRLLDRILEKPEPETPRAPMEISVPKNIPWNVRRQMLEREDRERAKLMKAAPKPESVEDLEKELDLASTQREKTS